MKTLFPFLLLLLIISPLYGQEKDNLSRHQVSVDLGSYRNRYLYPITNLKYTSPLLTNVNLRISARLRSYGTWYLYSKSSYDFTPIAEYYFTRKIKPLYFSAGIGLDTRIRLVRDERSTAKSSAEPLIHFAANGNYKKIYVQAPLWTRFYSNGITFSILPEASFQISNRFLVFLRYELSYLRVYRGNTYEWRQDCFIGTQILF